MRREAAAIRIQKNVRACIARRHYQNLKASAIVIQTGLRAMAARNEFRHKRKTKAATLVQVPALHHVTSIGKVKTMLSMQIMLVRD